ncbi:hypothetical protein [Luteibacter sp.]|uniref:hypothetical protein n=1 Tax=Luteibacter sp. TaxID=1886636 RepID=UPI0028071A3F|nr:hypothetical protein [Luteibacter sp.]MDQ8050865.1 hypothetical protein [Luteibacter sp.]
MGEQMLKLKTDARVLQALQRVPTPSREEVKEQKVSFVFASIDSKSNMTKEQVRKLVEQVE